MTETPSIGAAEDRGLVRLAQLLRGLADLALKLEEPIDVAAGLLRLRVGGGLFASTAVASLAVNGP